MGGLGGCELILIIFELYRLASSGPTARVWMMSMRVHFKILRFVDMAIVNSKVLHELVISLSLESVGPVSAIGMVSTEAVHPAGLFGVLLAVRLTL